MRNYDLVIKNFQNFCNNANKIFDCKFDYSLSDYKNAHTKIDIICSIHGKFLQSPSNHLAGKGCPKCKFELLSDIFISSEEQFIKKARILSDKFSYDKVQYKNSKSKVIITCKIHGDFTQTPANHLFGQACPKCKESKGEKLLREFLNKNNIIFKSQFKIDSCRYKKPLLFDFAIFHNEQLLGLLEYNGEYHYQKINFGNLEKAETRLEITKHRDKIKSNYCKAHNIPLLVIPYWEKSNATTLVQNFVCEVSK